MEPGSGSWPREYWLAEALLRTSNHETRRDPYMCNMAQGSQQDGADAQEGFHIREMTHASTWLIFNGCWTTELGCIVLLYSLPKCALSIGLTAQQASIVGAVLSLGLALGRSPIGCLSDTFGRINVAGGMSTFVGYAYRFVRHSKLVSYDGVPVACSPNDFGRYTLTREQPQCATFISSPYGCPPKVTHCYWSCFVRRHRDGHIFWRLWCQSPWRLSAYSACH